MLSQDLEMLRREMSIRIDADGRLTLSALRTDLIVNLILGDCVSKAKQLEANAVRQPAVLVDLSDPKIELFSQGETARACPLHRVPRSGGRVGRWRSSLSISRRLVGL